MMKLPHKQNLIHGSYRIQSSFFHLEQASHHKTTMDTYKRAVWNTIKPCFLRNCLLEMVYPFNSE